MLRTVFLAGLMAFVEFEAATVKPSAPSPEGRIQMRMSSDTSTGKVEYSNVTLKDVIARAYRVQPYQVSGPDWMATERFEISARFAAHSEPDQLLGMLQSLLADRFKLALHRETRELPLYWLTVTKGGPKLKASDSASGVRTNNTRTQSHATVKLPMAGFAEFLTGQAGRPVFDKTELKGSYEFTLDWAPDAASDAAPPTDAAPLPSLFTALQEQLGLKLEAGKGPVEMLVVDRAERTPAEN